MNRQPDESVPPSEIASIDQTTDFPAIKPDQPTPLPSPQRETDRVELTPKLTAADTELTGAYVLDTEKTSVFPSAPETEPVQRGGPSAFPVIPGYEILAELGRGGMGVVYRARQAALDRVVALKMILSGPFASEAALARFDAEARAVARLQHPNIVQIFDVGIYHPPGDEQTALPYFSLEFVAGDSLAKAIGREPQAPVFAANTVLPLARAVHYAHEKGIIHRDLKPANVLVGTDGTVKLTDFGVAKRLDDDAGQTQSGQIVGTPAYMSPEQANGDVEHLGPTADIYSLGAILYDMLAGRPPFTGTGVMNVLEQVRLREPVAPSILVGKIPKDLETICLKCLQKDPARRYASAGELADDVQRYLDGRPILARPISGAERAWRWAKRNPWVASLSGTVALLLIVVALVTSVMSYRLSIKNREVEKSLELEAAAKKKAEEEELKAKQAYQQETIAKKQTEAALATTEEQRRLALDTIRGVLLKVDDIIRHDLRLSGVRLAIVKQMLVDLDKIRNHAAVNPLDTRTEAVAYQRIGELYAMTNRTADAMTWTRKAYDISKAIAEKRPDDIPLVRNYAAMSNRLADLEWEAGNGQEARRLHAQALKLRETRLELAKKQKDERLEFFAAYDLADSFGLVAFTDLRLGDPQEALKGYQTSEAKFASLPHNLGKNALQSLSLRRIRAEIQMRMADCYFRVKDNKNAEACMQKSFTEREALVTKYTKGTDVFVVRSDLALCRMNMGDYVLMAHGDTVAAAEHYGRAYRIYQSLGDEEPDHIQVRQGVSAAQYRLAYLNGRRTPLALLAGPAVEGALKNHFAMECLASRALLAKADEQNLQHQVDWLLALARLNQATQAETVATRLLNVAGKDRSILFQVACGYAILGHGTDATANGYRGQAIDVLKKLVAQGWKDRIALQHDPDLETLRHDDRLKQLLATIP